MGSINWKVRFKNPAFIMGLTGAIGTPILAYLGVAASDLTTWESVGGVAIGFISNPYLIGVTVLSVMSFLGVVADPTTKLWSDSTRALDYEEPYEDNPAHMR